ncbi:MAG: HlyD family efflux transporter periplasmic adaptor subunit [Myxococcales bacterium]|nr:HlyD family efflux transporter periplasmic adaptor subunit [Myxococcales bacterium]
MPAGAIPMQAATPFFDCVRRITMQRDLVSAEHLMRREIAMMSSADRVYCLYHQPHSASLWALGDDDKMRQMPAKGLAVFAARSGSALCAERAYEYPEYNGATDDPEGDGRERMIVQPVAVFGEVLAVVVAVRRGQAPSFNAHERGMIAAFVELCAPAIKHLLLAKQAKGVERQQSGGGVFRTAALDAHSRGKQGGRALRLTPRWVRYAYISVLLLVALGVTFSALAKVRRYSGGPAIVWIEGDEVNARQPGSVARVLVAPGDAVRAGQPLVRFHAGDEEAELRKLDTEYERQLAAFLLDTGSKAARSALSATTTRRERARAKLQSLTITSPSAGLVNDVRVRIGMAVKPGERLLTVVQKGNPPTVVAFLPGRDRPQLEVGQKLSLELDGFRRQRHEAVVKEVGREVLGPSEAKRYIGGRAADTLNLSGPVVLVKAQLSKRTFESDGVTYKMHDGMRGLAEIALESKSLLQTLLLDVTKK